ncbi:phage tail protein [Sphingomonas sp. MMS24-J45]|uniref:phage tail protein n=1 Tax=Sphingomonas sp. MMS24-J45 TaxID=3238806 RepID=UPI00384C4AC3
MATLVLTAIGSVVGGPVGGAIGAVIGNAVDRTILFKPKGREGPRLTELKLQTSSYGTQIPRLFGTMRIGGCVVWATDLVESRSTSSNGKGQPSTTNYSYSASFAVALSARRIAGVGRIWADGKLLRGAGGDFKSATGFRLHLGDEGQAVDPLIAAAEGSGLTPAHRGIAYAVFEHFQLADYGNRIPSLTFEVIADDAPVTVGAIAADLSGGVIDGGEAGQVLGGFAAYGDSVRGVVETLAVAGGAWFAPVDGGVRMRAGLAVDRAIADGDTVAAGSSRGKHGRAIAALETVPRSVMLAHYDPARDFQTGVQHARRPGAGTREERVEMPAAIDAGAAKTMAEAVLSRGEAGRERRTVTLGWDALDVVPGACVTIAGVSGVWRVSGWAFERSVVHLECVRLAAGTLPLEGSPGRVLSAPDVTAGATLLAAFETLPLDDAVLRAPRITVVAAGTEPGWRRAMLSYSTDGGGRWTSLGATAAPGVIGQIVTVPGMSRAALVDRRNAFEIELAHEAMALSSADWSALDAGVNLALIGDELLQFGTAEQISATRWRLSGLWRGRRATEAKIGTQGVGDRFVLIERESALSLDLPLSAVGGEVRIMASGTGDTAGPVETRALVAGGSILPPAPVGLRWSEVGNGDAAVRWIRRSRAGWRWIDGVDVPLGEEREAYRVTLLRDDGSAPTIETATPAMLVTAAERAGGVMVSVRQVGALGESISVAIRLLEWTM